jgi:t-SNARE complex subunit (syntaxin)
MSVNHLKQVKTREEHKKTKEDGRKAVEDTTTQKASKVKSAQKARKAESTNKRIRIRLIPIWLRIVLLVIFTGVFAVAATMPDSPTFRSCRIRQNTPALFTDHSAMR